MTLQKVLEKLPTFDLLDKLQYKYPGHYGWELAVIFSLKSDRLIIRHAGEWQLFDIASRNLSAELGRFGIEDKTDESLRGSNKLRSLRRGSETAQIEVIGHGRAEVNVPAYSYRFHPVSIYSGFSILEKAKFEGLIRQNKKECPASPWRFYYERSQC